MIFSSVSISQVRPFPPRPRESEKNSPSPPLCESSSSSPINYSKTLTLSLRPKTVADPFRPPYFPRRRPSLILFSLDGEASSMKLRFRWAHRLFIALQVVASFCALIITIPCMIILFAFLFIPDREFCPSDTFHALRHFFFRVFAGRTLRPFTLRASLPAGSNIRSSNNTTI